MFLLPTGNHEDGKSDDNPIHLGGIRKDEFELLLSVLLHRSVYRTNAQRRPPASGVIIHLTAIADEQST
jgi:hypothetical protein